MSFVRLPAALPAIAARKGVKEPKQSSEGSERGWWDDQGYKRSGKVTRDHRGHKRSSGQGFKCPPCQEQTKRMKDPVHFALELIPFSFSHSLMLLVPSPMDWQSMSSSLPVTCRPNNLFIAPPPTTHFPVPAVVDLCAALLVSTVPLFPLL